VSVRLVVILFSITSFGALALVAGCGGSKSLAGKSAHELFDLGKTAHEKGKYRRAIEMFQQIVYNYPGDPVVDTAQYYLGLAYYGTKDYGLAEVEFNRLTTNYPSSVYFEQAMFMKAVSKFDQAPRHYGLDQTELTDAIQQFEDFIIDFPESELLPEVRRYLLQARTRLARKYYESGVVYIRLAAYEAAKTYFQWVIDDFTETEFGPKAAYRYAEMEFKLGHFDEAKERFKNFLTVFPDHEWAEKTMTQAIESAFRSGEKAFQNGDYALARRKLEAFQSEFPDNGWTEKADEYLEEITRLTREKSQANEADS
jgi:outer membrane protein assembly factor BamD